MEIATCRIVDERVMNSWGSHWQTQVGLVRFTGRLRMEDRNMAASARVLPQFHLDGNFFLDENVKFQNLFPLPVSCILFGLNHLGTVATTQCEVTGACRLHVHVRLPKCQAGLACQIGVEPAVANQIEQL